MNGEIIDWNNCHTSEQIDSIATTKDDLAVDKAKKDSELIARGDVINMIKEVAEYHTGDSFNADRLIRNIKELPSVTPQEPKTGEWIENAPEYQNIDPPYICSECGNAHLRKTNYCDQCGARMIELQESEG